MTAIQIADFYILKNDHSERSVNWINLIIWAVGFAVYRLLMQADIIVGNTLPDMIITVILCIIVHKIRKK